MKKFTKLLLLLLCLMLLFTAGCTDGSYNSKEIQGNDSAVGVQHVRQIVAAENKTGRTIMWQAEAEQEYTLEYRLAGSNDSKTISTKKKTFQEAGTTYIQYAASLSDLEAGSKYQYRINTVKEKGAWHELTTDSGKNFTALIFPDSQSNDYSGWQKLARDAQTRHQETQLYINLGDLVDNGQDASQWRAWFNSVEPFSDKLAFAPVIGNHEAYSLQWKTTQPVSYTNLFQVPANGLAKYPNQFYSFDYGPVHFAVLNTNFYEAKDWQPQLLQDQLQWLTQDLAQSKAKWKVVLQHRDIFMYTFGKESGRPQRPTEFLDFSRELIPIFEKYNVDAVLSAHLHTYRRRVPLRNFVPANDGITYILAGVAGNVRYPKLWGEFAWDAARAPQPETANYMTLEAEANKLTFKAYLSDGKQFDEVVISKG